MDQIIDMRIYVNVAHKLMVINHCAFILFVSSFSKSGKLSMHCVFQNNEDQYYGVLCWARVYGMFMCLFLFYLHKKKTTCESPHRLLLFLFLFETHQSRLIDWSVEYKEYTFGMRNKSRNKNAMSNCLVTNLVFFFFRSSCFRSWHAQAHTRTHIPSHQIRLTYGWIDACKRISRDWNLK